VIVFVCRFLIIPVQLYAFGVSVKNASAEGVYSLTRCGLGKWW